MRAAGAPTLAVAAHSGNCRTAFGDELHPLIRGIASPRLGWLGLFQAADLGALAVLRAALDPTACGGDYCRWLRESISDIAENDLNHRER
ncbi:hypothetical protein GKO32_21785 [Amycolatopsis sp. RM579]|uniref:Uncharacterized protein n=1 Tax=Amycolatopsis pithecellobii TaxID=664692 RepID=A0A6N7YXC6_9PSEU|nr:hypothetical protein [Amycolatopsis pithecellobii]